MDRRSFLMNSVSVAAMVAAPAPVLAALPKLTSVAAPVLKSYAVGTDSGEMDWEFILAESAELAEKIYAKENGFECDCGDEQDDCECCLAYIDSQRVPGWDALGDSGPSAVDWVSEGLSSGCNICAESCSSENDIITIGIRRFIVCEYCREDAEKGELDLVKSLGSTS